MNATIHPIRHLILMLLLGLTFAPLRAQESKQQPQQPEQKQQIEAPEVDDQSIKLFLDKIEVEGKLEKPQAVFIIPGTNPEIDDIRIERSFFDEIFRPVEKKGRAITRPVAKPKTERTDVIPW
ncbi:hypothetical protein JXO59_06760 [candidate division KSB1 bacterium]|nr:hypothetical protein [candidate division KSB1 bacterium]